MTACEVLRRELDSRTPESGVVFVSQKDAREILDTYDRLHYVAGAAAREFDQQMIRLAEPSEPTAAGPRPAA